MGRSWHLLAIFLMVFPFSRASLPDSLVQEAELRCSLYETASGAGARSRALKRHPRGFCLCVLSRPLANEDSPGCSLWPLPRYFAARFESARLAGSQVRISADDKRAKPRPCFTSYLEAQFSSRPEARRCACPEDARSRRSRWSSGGCFEGMMLPRTVAVYSRLCRTSTGSCQQFTEPGPAPQPASPTGRGLLPRQAVPGTTSPAAP